MPQRMVHVFIGTKAQYIKTAPVLRELRSRDVPYRLIDSGQHGRLAVELRRELGIPEPDLSIGGSVDVTAIPQALWWAAGIAVRAVDRRRLRREVFADRPGVCIVHGDTPSTLLATLLARRAGLRVAHLEAGLRSERLLHPFPEEIIRRVVMRASHRLFAPDETAERNLAARGLASRTVRTSANTVVDALRWSLGDGEVTDEGPVIVTMHRVENLHRRERVARFVHLVASIAQQRDVTFVTHGPTISVVEPYREQLLQAGVRLEPLVPHAVFTRMLARAPFVVTDGGSIQEECALLGVPTLLWRAGTERPDGTASNVVVSRYDERIVERFLREPDTWRRLPAHATADPSSEIVDQLLRDLQR
jgi:UDP-N-acetylglucosamine 2-epimerase (non-hydrolysing)